jgi:hypothetical protein
MQAYNHLSEIVSCFKVLKPKFVFLYAQVIHLDLKVLIVLSKKSIKMFPLNNFLHSSTK